MRRLSVFLLAALASAAALPASADVLVTVDKAAQRMTVAVDGQDRYSWPVSTGVADHDTPSGSFQPSRMDRDHFSREWDDAPMPYAIFFTDMGHAIHGTGHVAALGRPASHGCVRLSRPHAAELFALVKAEGLGRTRVVVEGDDAEAGPRPRRSRGRRPLRRRVRHAPLRIVHRAIARTRRHPASASSTPMAAMSSPARSTQPAARPAGSTRAACSGK